MGRRRGLPRESRLARPGLLTGSISNAGLAPARNHLRRALDATQSAGWIKVTIDLDGQRYRAVKVEVSRSDRSVGDIVDQTLEAWLAAAEEIEGRTSAEAGLLVDAPRVPEIRSRRGSFRAGVGTRVSVGIACQAQAASGVHNGMSLVAS